MDICSIDDGTFLSYLYGDAKRTELEMLVSIEGNENVYVAL